MHNKRYNTNQSVRSIKNKNSNNSTLGSNKLKESAAIVSNNTKTTR